jgi:cell wall-associated NlpC family hydrolase
MAISGLGVAVVTAGGVLMYAALQDMNPLAALKEIGTGKARPVVSTAGSDTSLWDSLNPFNQPGVQQALGGGLPQLVAAVRQFAGDHYSELARNQPGYSDCSSFVGKGFKAIGITPPGSSTTPDYLAWSALKKIPESSLAPGDLVVNMAHMIVATGSTTGIGQQNGRRNVQEGSISDLMYGTGSYVCLRYVGTTAAHPQATQTATGSGSSGSSAPTSMAV